MLTPPAGVTLADYIAALRSDNPTHIRLTFTRQNIVLGDADVHADGLVIEDFLNSEVNLRMGVASMRKMSVPVINSGNLTGIVWSSEVQVEVGVEINSVTKWVTVGYFIGKRPDKVMNVDVIQFTAYDRMSLFDRLADEWLASISYPKTVGQLLQSLCSYCGVTYEAGDELSDMLNRSYSSAPIVNNGLTCRTILSLIAEACGCYAKITAGGNLKLVWFGDHTADYTVRGDDEFNLDSFDILEGRTWQSLETSTWADLEQYTWMELGGTRDMFNVYCLNVRQTEEDTGVYVPARTESSVYTIIDNPFLVTKNEYEVADYIKPIYYRLNGLGGYIPLAVECVGNALIEAGDIITVSVKGTDIAVPVFAKTTVFNGCLTDRYEATGQLDWDKLTMEEKEQLSEGGRYHIFRNDINELYSEVFDEDGNSIIEQNSNNINLLVAGKYDIQSNIDIKPEGIEITGGKYVKITSGGTFDVDSTDFKIDSTNKLIELGNWKYDPEGSVYQIDDQNFFVIGSKDVWEAGRNVFRIFCENNVFTIESTITKYASTPDTAYLRIDRESDPRGSTPPIVGGSDPVMYIEDNTHSPGWIGSAQHKMNGYFDSLYYVTMNQSSSKDIKHDIKPMEDMGGKIDKLKPVTFVYDSDREEKKRYGLIYEDAVEVLPDICNGIENGKAINYMELVPMLLKEIQELRARVKTLEEREET